MGYSAGLLIGAVIGLYVVTTIVHWAIVKRIIADSMQARITSLLLGYIVAGVLSGFGNADGGPFVWSGFWTYGLAAIIVAPLKLWELRRTKATRIAAETDTFR